jgi:hypothetical protein
MRLKKQIVLMCLALVAFAGLSLLTSSAFALPSQLTVGAACGGIDGLPLTIPITVDDPEDIAGAAFTLEHASALDITVSSNFFTHILYNQKDTTNLLVAAVRADGALASASKTIMTLTVRLKAGFDGGSYDITIKPSVILNEEFGYPASDSVEKRTLDLITSDVGSPLISGTDFDAGSAVVNGSASFYSDEIDTDQDGYTDLQECINGTDPEIPSAQGGDGYEECLDSRVKKQLVELSGPADVVVGDGFELDVIYTDDYQAGDIDVTVYYDPEMVQYNQSVETPGEIDLSFTGPVTETLSFTTMQSLGDALFRVEPSSTTNILFCNMDTTVTIRPDCVTPVINDFRASSTSVTAGQSVTLSWDVTGDENTIVGIQADVFGGPSISGLTGSVTVRPYSTTTYTLIARNSCGDDTRSLTVGVSGGTTPPSSTPAPSITAFSADPETIGPNGETTLSWRVTGRGVDVSLARLENVGLFGAIRPVEIGTYGPIGSAVVKPQTTTQYQITARNSGGSVTARTTVSVTGEPGSNPNPGECTVEPGIRAFSADRDEVAYGGGVVLSWEISGAESISIEDEQGQLVAGEGLDPVTGQVPVYPQMTTRYILKAHNQCGTASMQTDRIKVNCNVPGIKFLVNGQKSVDINYGDRVGLTWEVSGADEVTIDGIGNVDPQIGEYSLVPEKTKNYYVMTATNSCGSTAVQSVEVNVKCNAPGIKSFLVNGEEIIEITAGDPVSVSWEVVGADEVYIDEIGDVDPQSGTVEFEPQSPGTYMLTASSGCGETAHNAIKISFGSHNLRPDAPQLVSPADNSEGETMTPTLKAGEFSDEDGNEHVLTRWQISKDNSFDDQSLVYDEQTDEYLTVIAVPSQMVLEPGTRYYWRVKYFDGELWSFASEVNSFVTTSNGPEYENGIRLENIISNGEEVLLGNGFVDENGLPINTDTMKVFKSEVNEELQIGIHSEKQGVAISKCGALDPDNFPGTDDVTDPPEFLNGLIEIALDLPNKEDEAEITIYFSDPIPEGAIWYKFDKNLGEFYDYERSTSEEVVVFNDDRKSVTLRLKDGGFGDLIDEPDGRIIDPGGLSLQSQEPPPSTSGGGGGGGGGCFIRSLLGK